MAVAVVGVAAAVGWTLWGADDSRSKPASEPAAEAKAAACESVVKKLASGATLSRSEIETFRSQCGKPAPSR